MKTPLIFAVVAAKLWAGELEYYKQDFEARYKYPVYDTLFEKIVWERKVSHLVMEFHSGAGGKAEGGEYRVTLLMMEEYPHNYKGQNYPIHFSFKNFAEAAAKYEFMNNFLRNNGVMAVGIDGKRIVKERILVQAVGSATPRPGLTPQAPLSQREKGVSQDDPILTREPLPRRLPLEKRYDSATQR